MNATTHNPTLDAATESRVRTHVGITKPADLRSRPRETWRPGEVAMVHAFGAWRTGVIVKVGRTRATVAYITPSNRQLVRFATTDDVRIGASWTPDRDRFAGQEFPLVAGHRHDQSITPTADDEPPRTV